MSEFVQEKNLLKWQVGLETDIGGGKENQDECFVWIKKDDNLIVLCVLDGHGREVGRIAAESAKNCLFQYLDDHYLSLIDSPSKFLVKCHEIAHENIKSSFKSELEGQGFEVKLSEEGYLLKRRPPAEQWSCIHGGTSCSMVALVKETLYVANVGDSTGILCSTYPIFDQSTTIEYIADSAVTSKNGQHTTDSSTTTENAPLSRNGGCVTNTGFVLGIASESSSSSLTNTLLITAEHSPESPYEFNRLRDFRRRAGDTTQPALVVVYDSNSHDKNRCSAVFATDEQGGLVVTNKGSYYKNVRKEWASLVSTPPYARFQDALAFTRSLGDLHLHTYGVTHLPEVQCIHLAPIFVRLREQHTIRQQNKATEAIPTSASPDGEEMSVADRSASDKTALVEQVGGSTLCLVLATDGVWDNWLYEDVNRFVLDSSCLGAVAGGADGARRVTMSFMQRNSTYSKRNFGSQADNATGIVMYLSDSPTFPAL